MRATWRTLPRPCVSNAGPRCWCCGDDDRATEARTGTNTGRVKAEAAARAVRGLAVFPEGLPDGGSDFNDMHRAGPGGRGRLH